MSIRLPALTRMYADPLPAVLVLLVQAQPVPLLPQELENTPVGMYHASHFGSWSSFSLIHTTRHLTYDVGYRTGHYSPCKYLVRDALLTSSHSSPACDCTSTSFTRLAICYRACFFLSPYSVFVDDDEKYLDLSIFTVAVAYWLWLLGISLILCIQDYLDTTPF